MITLYKRLAALEAYTNGSGHRKDYQPHILTPAEALQIFDILAEAGAVEAVMLGEIADEELPENFQND